MLREKLKEFCGPFLGWGLGCALFSVMVKNISSHIYGLLVFGHFFSRLPQSFVGFHSIAAILLQRMGHLLVVCVAVQKCSDLIIYSKCKMHVTVPQNPW